MNTGSNSVESKEKANSSAKENKDKEKVASDLDPKTKLFMTSTIIPIEIINRQNNSNSRKIKFVTTVDFNKENKKKEKEHSKNNPIFIPQIEKSKLNIFNNYIIFNYS